MARTDLFPVRPEWLALTSEETLEPEIPICDAHHHLWDHGPADRYLADELQADLAAGHKVRSTVFVECHSAYRSDGPEELRPVGETEFVDAIARGANGPARIAAAIVGQADLMRGKRASEVLEAHIEASPRFTGIRYWLNCEEDPAADVRSDAPKRLAYEPKFREGYACLQKYGLIFDAWIYFPQLPDLVDLARAFPEVPVVLNHAGGLLGLGPYARRDEWFPVWKRNISEVARCPNVVVKLGGLCVPRCGFHWHERPRPPSSTELAEALAPYCLHCIDEFGPDRCLFESNFPADKIACSYNVLWNAFKRITSRFSAAERAALFEGTATRVYRIK